VEFRTPTEEKNSHQRHKLERQAQRGGKKAKPFSQAQIIALGGGGRKKEIGEKKRRQSQLVVFDKSVGNEKKLTRPISKIFHQSKTSVDPKRDWQSTRNHGCV